MTIKLHLHAAISLYSPSSCPPPLHFPLDGLFWYSESILLSACVESTFSVIVCIMVFYSILPITSSIRFMFRPAYFLHLFSCPLFSGSMFLHHTASVSVRVKKEDVLTSWPRILDVISNGHHTGRMRTEYTFVSHL